MIPDPEEIRIEKLGLGGSVNTDTCAAAQKERRLIVQKIGGRCHEQDCWNHLRNVWINGMSKSVSKFLNEYLEDSLEEISSILRVNPDLSSQSSGRTTSASVVIATTLRAMARSSFSSS